MHEKNKMIYISHEHFSGIYKADTKLLNKRVVLTIFPYSKSVK